MPGSHGDPSALLHVAFQPSTSRLAKLVLMVVTEKQEGSRTEQAPFQVSVCVRFTTVILMEASHEAKPRVSEKGPKACGFREA